MGFAVIMAVASKIFVSWNVDPYNVLHMCSTSVSEGHSASVFGLTSEGINVNNKACMQQTEDFNSKLTSVRDCYPEYGGDRLF
jgi:hypothetical protein